MVFRPVRDFLVVEPLESGERVSSGGIVLPDSAQKANLRGRVVRVGDGRWNGALGRFQGFSVDTGDVVLFNQFAGFDLEVDGVVFRVIRDVDIVGVFEE